MSANSLTGRSGVTPERGERDPKPTPGPWQQSHRKTSPDAYNTQVYTQNGETICTVHWYPRPADPSGWVGTYREANARLIAAAPELLESLEALDANWRIGGYSGPDDPRAKARFTDETLRIWAMARAAITKATGSPAALSTPSTGATQEANQ